MIRTRRFAPPELRPLVWRCMQKVVGSSRIIRSPEPAGNGGFRGCSAVRAAGPSSAQRPSRVRRRMPSRRWTARSSSPSFLAAQMNSHMTAAKVQTLTAAITIPRNVLIAATSTCVVANSSVPSEES